MSIPQEKKKKKSKKIKEEVEVQVKEQLKDNAQDWESPEKSVKKKKKKRHSHSIEEELAESSYFEEPSPKKKRKNKEDIKDESFMDEEVSPSKNKKKSKKKKEKQQEVLPAQPEEPVPKKKRRKKGDDVAAEGQQQSPAGAQQHSSHSHSTDEQQDHQRKNNVTKSQTEEAWNREDEMELINRMKLQLPENDSKGYRTTLNKIKWEEVAFGDRIAEVCQQHFLSILSKLSTMKTLTTLMEDAMVWCSTPSLRIRQVPKPYSRFIKHFLTQDKLDALKAKKENVLAACRLAWENLSVEKKQCYFSEYTEELHKLNLGNVGNNKNKQPIFLPDLPYKVWATQEGCTLITSKSIKEKFDQLKKKHKLPYIRRALVEYVTFKEKVSEYKESHPEYEIPKILIRSFQEYVDVYLSGKSFPVIPQATIRGYHYNQLLEAGDLKDVQPSQRMIEATKLWKALSKEKKEELQQNFQQKVKTFLQEVEDWDKGRDEVDLIAKELHLLPHLKKLTTLKRQTGEQSLTPKRKRPKKAPMESRFKHQVATGLTCPKFRDIPKRPGSTAFLIFKAKFKKVNAGKYSSSAEATEACKTQWNRLSPQDKEAYKKACNTISVRYEKQLLDFVEQMDKNQRQVFLGFHRANIYKFFNRDIFEELYPNDEYPVYLPGSSPSKVDRNVGKGHTSDSEDNERLPSSDDAHSDSEKGEKSLPLLSFNDDSDDDKDEDAKPLDVDSDDDTDDDAKSVDVDSDDKDVEKEFSEDSEDDSEESEEEVEVVQHEKKFMPQMTSTKNGQLQKRGEESDSEESSSEDDVAPAWMTRH